MMMKFETKVALRDTSCLPGKVDLMKKRGESEGPASVWILPFWDEGSLKHHV